jgi:hypothetical protein
MPPFFYFMAVWAKTPKPVKPKSKVRNNHKEHGEKT